jgi:alpha-glucosidase
LKPWQVTHCEFEQQRAQYKMVDGGSLSVRFLAPALCRVTLQMASGFKEPHTWAIAPVQPGQSVQDVPWAGRARLSQDGFALPQVTQAQLPNGNLVLSTSQLSVTLNTQQMHLSWADSSNSIVTSDRQTSAYLSNARTGCVRHYLQRHAQQMFFGLGDKTGPLNLAGRRLRTLALDSLGYDPEQGDPLYKHWPFFLSRSAHGKWFGVYYDTLAACTFDLGCEHDNYHGLYHYVDIDDGDLDYYLMVGDTPAQVIAQWMQLIGGTHLPPQWSMGYAQTAMGLTDAPNAQELLSEFIQLARSHAVPISAFHYGSGYSSRGKQRYVFTWNRDKFPNPTQLNQQFHDAGMKVVANIKPCLLNDHPAYAQLAQSGGFIRHEASLQPIVEPFWDGQGSHLDFTNADVKQWWQQQFKSQLLNYGVDAGWNDNNEYAIADESAQAIGVDAAMPLHRHRALQSLLMTRATFEAHEGQGAAFTVSRAGSPGIQRYAQTWSGDNTTSWRTLRWNIRTGLQMSLSGLFNTGHDVGGFHGPVPDAQLFLRWVQACCLNPRMVMNSWKEGGISNLPWMHPQVTQEVIAAIKLRYRLMPYLAGLFGRATTHFEPIIRPTFYDFPKDELCFADCDDFMVGKSLLMAPVVELDASVRRVYLPTLTGSGDNNAWFDFHTGARFEPGRVVSIPVNLSSIVLFVRGGTADQLFGAQMAPATPAA